MNFSLKRYTNTALFVVSLIICFWVSGCGGGSDSVVPAAPESASTLQVSVNELNFAVPANGSLAPAEIYGTILGSPAQAYVFVLYTNRGIQFISQPATTDAQAKVEVVPKPASWLKPGVYEDTITINACYDAECKRHLINSPHIIPVTYRIGLSLTPDEINFQQVEGSSPFTQTVQLDAYDQSKAWTANVVTSNAANNLPTYLNISPKNGTNFPSNLTISVSTPPVGEYNETVQIGFSSDTQNIEARKINLRFTVLPLLEATKAEDFLINRAIDVAAYQRNVKIKTRDEARPTSWTAEFSSPQSWIKLNNFNGSTSAASNLQVELVPSEVIKLRNGSYQAEVVVKPSTAASPIKVPFKLVVDRPVVYNVSPYASVTGKAERVLISGDYFDSTFTSSVKFGSVEAVSFKVENSHRIWATHPPLPAGVYSVNVQVNGKALDSTAQLLVSSPTSLVKTSTGSFPSNPFSSKSFFNRALGACYFTDGKQVGFTRSVGNSWQTIIGPALDTTRSLLGFAMGSNGQSVMLLYYDRVVHLDPLTLEVTQTDTFSNSAIKNFYSPGFFATENGAALISSFGNGILRYTPTQGITGKVANTEATTFLWGSLAGNNAMWSNNVFSASLLLVDSSSLISSAPTFIRSSTTRTPVSDRFGELWAIPLDGNSTTESSVVVINSSGGVVTTINQANASALAFSNSGKLLVVATQTSPAKLNFYQLVSNGVEVNAQLKATLDAPDIMIDAIHFSLNEKEVVVCKSNAVFAVAVPSTAIP